MGADVVLSQGDSAPYLKEYFKKVKEFALIEMDVSVITLRDGPDAAEVKHREAEALLQSALPLLKQSFDRHDKDETGVLTKEEAAVFFSNVVGLQGPFAEMVAALEVKESIKLASQFFGNCPRDQIDAKFNKKKREIERLIARQILEYKADKVVRDKKAFKVIDTIGDGKIHFPEFEAALNPNDRVNADFLSALGLKAPDV